MANIKVQVSQNFYQSGVFPRYKMQIEYVHANQWIQ